MSFVQRLAYKPNQVGPLIGGMNERDVLRLIHAGKLGAKRINVRGSGKCDRYLITQAHINAYLESLDEAGPAPSQPSKTFQTRRQPKQQDGIRSFVKAGQK